MINLVDIANGHLKRITGSNEELSQNRLKICYSCPLYSKRLGGICNNKLWLNPITGDVSTTKKQGYYRGCGCILDAKTRLPNAVCSAGKW